MSNTKGSEEVTSYKSLQVLEAALEQALGSSGFYYTTVVWGKCLQTN